MRCLKITQESRRFAMAVRPTHFRKAGSSSDFSAYCMNDVK
jgi:hypothetical protein